MFCFPLRIFTRGKVRFNPHRDFGNGRAACKENYSSVIPLVSARDLMGNLDSYNEIIDVRTPAEHGEDNILNTATNLPVLSEEERVEVGTLYSKDKFKARKIGAALISRNIHKHILEHFLDKDKSYRCVIVRTAPPSPHQTSLQTSNLLLAGRSEVSLPGHRPAGDRVPANPAGRGIQRVQEAGEDGPVR